MGPFLSFSPGSQPRCIRIFGAPATTIIRGDLVICLKMTRWRCMDMGRGLDCRGLARGGMRATQKSPMTNAWGPGPDKSSRSYPPKDNARVSPSQTENQRLSQKSLLNEHLLRERRSAAQLCPRKPPKTEGIPRF